MSAPHHLLFPIDAADDDLDYRLALAVLAARPQNRVYIGPYRNLLRLAQRVRGGVFLGKTPGTPDQSQGLEDYRLLKDRGFVCLYFDPDGTSLVGPRSQWRQRLIGRLDPRHLDATDYICTWGDFQRDVYRDLDPACRHNIRTTGHPGYELYRAPWRSLYDRQASRLRARYGNFILVTTGMVGADGDLDEFLITANSEPGDRHRLVDQWTYQNEHLSHFVRLVHRLHVVFPDIPVIVRPEPSEDLSFYQMVFQGASSVHVLRRGPLAPWLLACQCLVYNGCTTGLRAHLGDRPAINFCPVDDPQRTSFLPQQFGICCRDEIQVVNRLIDLFGAQHRGETSPATLPAHQTQTLLHNLSGDAIGPMIEMIHEAEDNVGDTETAPELAIRIEDSCAGALGTVRHLARSVAHSGPVTGSDTGLPTVAFDTDDIGDRIARLEALTGQSVAHRVLSPSLMIVEHR